MQELALLLVAILMALLGAWEWATVGVVVAVFVTALVFRVLSMPKGRRVLFQWVRAKLAAVLRRRSGKFV